LANTPRAGRTSNRQPLRAAAAAR